jgi:hypothetical protein
MFCNLAGERADLFFVAGKQDKQKTACNAALRWTRRPLRGAGLAIGIVLVLGATGVAQAMLYEIKANDAVSMALAAVGASLIPAVRATTVQPVEVLREE